MERSVVIGCGSAYAEDRLEPALALAESGQIDYLVMDCLAERTLVHAQLRRLQDPGQGYDVRLPEIARRLVPACFRHGVRLVGNFGAANPLAGAERMVAWCRAAGLSGLRVASVAGDDVLELVRRSDPVLAETGKPLSALTGEVVTANAYLGADGVVAALGDGADVVMTGRVADPSLFLAPAMLELGWGADDWDRLAGGATVGHLLECGTYLTGGNFADPPYRVVPGMEDLGMPMARVDASGEAVLMKLPEAGGILTTDTCKAQLLYEIGDPAACITPDVVVDVRHVQVEEVGRDCVRVRGARGSPGPQTLKVLIGVLEGFIGEGEMIFAGAGALSRARHGAEIVQKRIAARQLPVEALRVDFIGLNAVRGGEPVLPPGWEPPEVRLRVAARCPDAETAHAVAQEVEWLFFGPAGAGGVRRHVRQILAMYTTFIDRDAVKPLVEIRAV